MLHKRLTELRKEYKRTQQDLADLLGITRPAYTAYEAGKRHPDYEGLIKIADFYNVSTDYLLGVTDNPSRGEHKDQWLKKFLAQPTVPYDENTYLTEEQLKPFRELLEQVVNAQNPKRKEKARKKKGES